MTLQEFRTNAAKFNLAANVLSQFENLTSLLTQKDGKIDALDQAFLSEVVMMMDMHRKQKGATQ